MVNEKVKAHYKFARSRWPALKASDALERARKSVTDSPTYYAPSIGTRNANGTRWVDNWSAYFRDMKYCDDVARSIRHNGWYSDSNQDATYRGAIFQLRGRNGKTQWLAGYVDSDNDGACIDFSEVFTAPGEGDDGDLRDAARRADRLAESAAEESREYDTAWQAGSMWRDIMDGLPAIRTEIRELIQAYHISPEGKARDVVVSAITEKFRERANAIKNADTLAAGDDDNYYFYPSARLIDAFNEGAGERVL